MDRCSFSVRSEWFYQKIPKQSLERVKRKNTNRVVIWIYIYKSPSPVPWGGPLRARHVSHVFKLVRADGPRDIDLKKQEQVTVGKKSGRTRRIECPNYRKVKIHYIDQSLK